MSTIAEQLRTLQQIQALDRELADLANRRAKREQAHRTRVAAVERDRQALAQANEQRRRLEVSIREQEGHADDARRKRRELEQKRDGAASARMLAAVEADLAATQQQQETAETAALEQMEELDALAATAAELQRRVDAQAAEAAAAQAAFTAEIAALDAEAAALHGRRAEAVAAVKPEAVEQYERLRTRFPVDALVAIDANGFCEGCSTRLPPETLRRTRTHNEWVVCPSCGRLLFDPADGSSGSGSGSGADET